MDAHNIHYAIQLLARAESFARSLNRWDDARQFRETATAAERELSRIERDLPRLLDAKRSADRAYDAYVTNPERNAE